MKILVFTPCPEENSVNSRLARLAAQIAASKGVEVDHASFSEFEMPFYDRQMEENFGLPRGAREMTTRISTADGVVIVSPEYNCSMPGTIKNAIDWLSKASPMPLRGKVMQLMSAGDDSQGGRQGLWSLRIPLESLNAFVLPQMFCLAEATRALGKEGELRERSEAEMLSDIVEEFLLTVRRFKKHPVGSYITVG
ncbi:NAD(P)H-dependent oxidoreductase [bacterium]|nr:NAD(P)H-dependent oxidoreductase [bacterium]